MQNGDHVLPAGNKAPAGYGVIAAVAVCRIPCGGYLRIVHHIASVFVRKGHDRTLVKLCGSMTLEENVNLTGCDVCGLMFFKESPQRFGGSRVGIFQDAQMQLLCCFEFLLRHFVGRRNAEHIRCRVAQEICTCP